ncbi:hypothetical protein ACOMHN_041590 [Nucella lapillus]
MTDDIIVHGKDAAEHDTRLNKVLQKLEDSGMTLNPDKCNFGMNRLEFMGFVLNQEGISPAPSKVQDVQNARRPETAAEVRSFLGLVNFNAKFIRNLASKAEPLRRLTKKNTPFQWGKEQEQAFATLKEDLASAATLAYFDQKVKTRVVADAGPVALGAVLIQCQNGQDRVISYASRSLSDVERRYSQTEKEALGLVWACERFHQYVYGIDLKLSQIIDLWSSSTTSKSNTNLDIPTLPILCLDWSEETSRKLTVKQKTTSCSSSMKQQRHLLCH